jgi:hypothetical protein
MQYIFSVNMIFGKFGHKQFKKYLMYFWKKDFYCLYIYIKKKNLIYLLLEKHIKYKGIKTRERPKNNPLKIWNLK